MENIGEEIEVRVGRNVKSALILEEFKAKKEAYMKVLNALADYAEAAEKQEMEYAKLAESQTSKEEAIQYLSKAMAQNVTSTTYLTIHKSITDMLDEESNEFLAKIGEVNENDNLILIFLFVCDNLSTFAKKIINY